jgi:hypothetical protein
MAVLIYTLQVFPDFKRDFGIATHGHITPWTSQMIRTMRIVSWGVELLELLTFPGSPRT